MKTSPLRNSVQTPLVIPAVLTALVLVAGNVAVGPLMEVIGPRDWAAVFVYWCFGTIAAGGGVAAIWGSLGLGRFIVRESIGFAIAIVLTVAGLIGALFAGERLDDDVAVPLLCMPLTFLAVQLPLLPMHFFFGWQLEIIGRSTGTKYGRVTIQGMMIGTAAVAVCFAMARGAISVAGEGPDLLPVLGIATASVAGLSLIGTLPTVCFTLRLRSPLLGIALQFSYVVVLLIILWTVLWALSIVFPRQGWQLPLWNRIGVSITIFACGGALSAAMLSLRALGFRLTRRSDVAEELPSDRNDTELAKPEFP